MNDEDLARIHAVKYLTLAIESHERGDFLSVSDGYTATFSEGNERRNDKHK